MHQLAYEESNAPSVVYSKKKFYIDDASVQYAWFEAVIMSWSRTIKVTPINGII